MTHDELARIAMRYDTAMSRAMLRALGVPVPARHRPAVTYRVDKYAGSAGCMRQRTGVRL